MLALPSEILAVGIRKTCLNLQEGLLGSAPNLLLSRAAWLPRAGGGRRAQDKKQAERRLARTVKALPAVFADKAGALPKLLQTRIRACDSREQARTGVAQRLEGALRLLQAAI